MNKVVYKLNESTVTVEKQSVTSYGVTAVSECAVENISTDKKFVEAIIKLFNDNGLEIIHMNAVIEDILSGCAALVR